MSQIQISHVTHEWIMPHLWMSHVTFGNESFTYWNVSCHKWECVTSHRRMSHVTYRNESCPISEWVMSHVGMSHVTYGNESCHIWECVSHIRMSHGCHDEIPYINAWNSSENVRRMQCKLDEKCYIYRYVKSKIEGVYICEKSYLAMWNSWKNIPQM